MKRLRNILISMVAVFGLAAPLAVPAVASAQAINDNLKCGANLSFDKKDCNVTTSGGEVDNLVENVVNVLSLVVGVVAVIMIIIGGLQYVLSGGDSGKVGNSKNTILYAVVGLVVVALAQIIVKFTVNSATQTK